jgi:hypothetical protein
MMTMMMMMMMILMIIWNISATVNNLQCDFHCITWFDHLKTGQDAKIQTCLNVMLHVHFLPSLIQSSHFLEKMESKNILNVSIVQPTRCTIPQIYFILGQPSTRFGRSLRPSSGGSMRFGRSLRPSSGV